MKIGDLIEVIAATCFVVAAVLATHHAWPGLIVAGVCLVYFAQVTAHTSIQLPRIRWRRKP